MKAKYFIDRNGQYYTEYTKEEIYSKIDNYNPDTFIPFLKALDYPYIKQEWEIYLLKYDNRIFGRYCSLMRLKGFRGFSYKDSDLLNEVREK